MVRNCRILPLLAGFAIWCLSGHWPVAAAAEPRVLVGGYRLELVAKEPDIVTPIGLSFDNKGRLLVVESHTHQRPQNYTGPATDRIRLASDSDRDGRFDRWTTFAEGFQPALNVLARPDGRVYVVERSQITLLADTDGDDVADERKVVLRLETTADYPHNGLSGIAIDHETQELVVGLGENFGVDYKLVGADGTAISGSGGKSGVFRCSLAGEKLRQIATGFWNPFSVCIAPHGRVFAVDNDPDSSPPCRLIHVVLGGDYGYLYQYGRSGLHPLQCWDGQLPGTLPMVAGTGEAPTAIVAHRGRLWVTSWGDHSIEAYKLVPRGASFSATREIVVQGDADFRPTGMAVAPDGSLYFGDWIRRDYPVHGTGRIWRLSFPSERTGEFFPELTEGEQLAATLRSTNRSQSAAVNFDTADPYLETAAAYGLAMNSDPANLARPLRVIPARLHRQFIRARRIDVATATGDDYLRLALDDLTPDVRLLAVRWIADERRTTLAADVASLLETKDVPDQRYYLAVLSAVDWLSEPTRQRNSRFSDALLVKELRVPDPRPRIQTIALSLISPNNPFLTSERLRDYLRSDHVPLRLAAVRALAQQTRPERFDLLAELAVDASQSDTVRAEAVMGLAAAAERFRPLLDKLAQGEDKVLRGEANRVLRLTQFTPGPQEDKPPVSDLAGWLKLLDTPGDAAAGRRLFFSAVGSRCAVCHQYDGQGGSIGPELTNVGSRVSRERLLASILRPSEEIAPRYQSWLLQTHDGRAYTGLRVSEAGDDGSEEYVDSAGKPFQLASNTIESRSPSSMSIMPEGLEKLISVEDLRDLVTFLLTPSDAAENRN